MVNPDRAADPVPEVPGYTLGELLGRGALGTVWAATRVADGRPVAVKVVSVAEEEEAHALARELAVLGRVAVEGLVGFHESVGLGGDEPAVALVLDHLAGGSLERAVQARGHLSVGESVTVLAPVARALAGLHALGVVHGDVSPANVLLERSGQPFLADLGVARLVGEAPSEQYGSLWGTPGFVAPEVCAGGVPTAASDVYAAGALAWWCVTGAAPEPGSVRRPLAEVAPGLPSAWSEVTSQALLGDPALRPTAAELALAYYDSADCEPLRLVVGGDETALLTQRLRRPAATSAQDPPPRPRRRVSLSLAPGRAAGLTDARRAAGGPRCRGTARLGRPRGAGDGSVPATARAVAHAHESGDSGGIGPGDAHAHALGGGRGPERPRNRPRRPSPWTRARSWRRCPRSGPRR